MINFLPDDVLLEIFDLYRKDEVATSSHLPWKWHRLAHVCRTWRDIIFASSRRLNLELHCTHGTPVKKNLGYLPSLPLFITFPGRLEDDDEDVLAALEHRDRVHVLSLNMPYPLAVAMAIQKPFPALTHLRLTSIIGPTTVLPDAFLGGYAPRLQEIKLRGVSFPAAPTLLLSACDLVDINLSSLGFRRPSYPDRICLPPITRTFLPALTRFYFRGRFKYLEDFVAQIDTPQLDCLRMECWEDYNFHIPQLCKLIDRSEKLKLSWFGHMDLHIQPYLIIIEIFHGGQSSFKLSVRNIGISQVLGKISHMLSNVDRLFVSMGFPGYGAPSNDIRWLELFHPFTAVTVLCIHDVLSDHFILALKNLTGERAAEVLPALELIYSENVPVASVEDFLATRRNVGRPVTFINKGEEFQEKLGLNVSE
ncbi:hypothetical protein EDB89DRAFT_2235528 [Lactarius sanguifluus]|nr:hypothetical protein EDB89DRAFT_2235528 [Lactarius sanguifluus]